LRGFDWPELLYAISMAIIFWAAMIPEWREVARLKREGEHDKLQEAREVRVASRLDGGTADHFSASSLLSVLTSWLGRKTSDA
jgi:hypothetical protein